MLSIVFQLTTAQTKMLLAIAYEDFDPDSSMLPRYKRGSPATDFVGVVRRLIDRGLVTHHADAPPYRVTPEGFSLAQLLVRECEWAVNLAAGREARHKTLAPLIEKENGYWSSVRKRLAK